MRLLLTVLVCLAASFGVVACGGGGGGGGRCSDNTIDGTYRFADLGVTDIHDASRYSFSDTALVTFDGNGNWSATSLDSNSTDSSLSFDGTDSGTYSVNGDSCEFDINADLRGYIVDNGNTILFSGVNTFRKTAIGIAILDDNVAYSDASLDGIYRFVDLGVTDIDDGLRYSFSDSALITFNGAGGWVANDLDSNSTDSSLSADGVDTGTYSVNADGEFDINADLRGYIVDNGNKILFAGVNTFKKTAIGIAVLDDDVAYSDASLDGTYRFADLGVTDIDDDGLRYSFSDTALITFDGSGNWTATDVDSNSTDSNLSFGGSDTGTYSVNAEGEFDLNADLTGFIVDNGNTILFSGVDTFKKTAIGIAILDE